MRNRQLKTLSQMVKSEADKGKEYILATMKKTRLEMIERVKKAEGFIRDLDTQIHKLDPSHEPDAKCPYCGDFFDKGDTLGEDQ